MADNPSNIVPDNLIVIEGGKQLVPAPSAGDSGKVLGVLNSNGDIGWTEDREGMAQQQADWAETDPSKVTFIANKPTIPSKTSDLQNDSGFITSSSLPTVDQTYNASSSNAQSGVAVASAIAGVNAVPASTSTDSGKVLKVDAQGAPVWDNAGGAFEIIEWNSATYNLVKAAYDSGKQPVILDKTTISDQPLYGYLVSREMDPYVPTRVLRFRFLSLKDIGAYFVSDQSATVVQYVVPNSGLKSSSEVKVAAKFTADSSVTLTQDGVGQIKISVANPLPASTSADADKVLTVNSSGTPEWATAQGGGGGGNWGMQTKYISLVDPNSSTQWRQDIDINITGSNDAQFGNPYGAYPLSKLFSYPDASTGELTEGFGLGCTYILSGVLPLVPPVGTYYDSLGFGILTISDQVPDPEGWGDYTRVLHRLPVSFQNRFVGSNNSNELTVTEFRVVIPPLSAWVDNLTLYGINMEFFRPSVSYQRSWSLVPRANVDDDLLNWFRVYCTCIPTQSYVNCESV